MTTESKASTHRSQLSTVNTPSENPRFTIVVDGVMARVTRLGFDHDDNPVIELTDTSQGIRDVFPTDTGYVGTDGVVYMRRQKYDEETESWGDVWWEAAGTLERALLRVGDSVSAELVNCSFTR